MTDKTSANTPNNAVADPSTAFTDEELAYHEAGHAVVHRLTGGTISRVSIDRGDPARGVHIREVSPSPSGGVDESSARLRIAVLMAGEVALFLHSGERRTVPDSRDRDDALRAARSAGADDATARAMINEEWDRVRERLREAATWKKVERLAAALVQHRALDGANVHELIDKAGS
ncbi:MAG: hypothetical protein HY332_16195 [Chloroflexi bacterium]|nr:hypothetical protein [Chloroflexota bacterium]